MAAETQASQRWQHIKHLLSQLLEAPSRSRPPLAEQLAQGDEALRDELLSLVAAAQLDEKLLEGIAPEAALEAMRSQLGDRSWSGRQVGPWRITALIARGGMGEVYRAERADGQFEQQVAVKLLRSGFDRQWLASRFAVERQIVARLDHPNLARVLDGGTTEEGMPYFVMELVEGEPIDRYCERLKLGVPERLALFRTVCQVVGYAHSKGVVHRDLKSDNILVTAQGVVKLVDFGIAKQIETDADETATGQRVMTLAFSSPEQVRGQEITPASDVYSLGVALYRLLTQASPYGSATADSGYELTRAICDTEPQPPSRADTTGPLSRSQRRRLRGDLDAVVMKALRKEPARRYANAAEMGDDIFRHMESLPVRARRGAWSYRANRFVLRHRVVFGAAMLANLALVFGLGLAVYQSVEANRQKLRAERHLASAREFANLMIFDVHDAIATLPGATAARKLVVDKALAYLEKINAEMPASPVLKLETASAYRKLADIQGAPYTPNLGDTTGALQNYQRALDILGALPPPEGLEQAKRLMWRAERLQAWSAVGRIRLDHGEREAALPLLRQAQKEAASWVAEAPDDVTASTQLARTYIALANADRHDVASGRALELLAQAEAAVAPWLARSPVPAPALRVALVASFTRGDYYRDRSTSPEDSALAMQAFEQTRVYGKALVALNPTDAKAVRDFAVAAMPYAQLLDTAGKHEQAAKLLNESIVSLDLLSSKDPDNKEVWGSLATLHGTLGSVYESQRRFDEAMSEHKLSSEILERTFGPEPANMMYRINLFHSHANHASAYLEKAKLGAGKNGSPVLPADQCARLARGLELIKTEQPPPYVVMLETSLREMLASCAPGGR